MNINNWRDHSSVYSQQHQKFYRWVLYPVILFLLLGSLFLFFAKKEVVVRVSAQLTATKIDKLQVPLEANIKVNNLKENKDVKKGEVLVTFDTSILQNEKEQFEQENTSLEEQKKAAQLFIESIAKEQNLFEDDDEFGYSNQLKSLLLEKETQNTEQVLATTKQKIAVLIETQKKNNYTLKNITEQLVRGTLKSPSTGIVHLNEEVTGQIDVSKGTVLAEIYPKQKESQLMFTALLPADEVTRIKAGMGVHFKLDKKGVASQTIEGTLKEISETSITTEQGTFYTIKGTLQPSKYFNNRYGMTGEVSLIIGKKTYWQQIKDTLLNQE